MGNIDKDTLPLFMSMCVFFVAENWRARLAALLPKSSRLVAAEGEVSMLRLETLKLRQEVARMKAVVALAESKNIRMTDNLVWMIRVLGIPLAEIERCDTTDAIYALVAEAILARRAPHDQE